MNKLFILGALLVMFFAVYQGCKVLDYVNSPKFQSDVTRIFN